MSGFTPGPWVPCYRMINGVAVSAHITAAEHGSLAPIAVVEADDRLPVEANARLIAAAPDTLEALEGLVTIIAKAGLNHLARGVELGQISWLVKATDRLEAGYAALLKAKGEA